jgi:predicted TIM-barrel fold metal-dependent hydrolase
MIIDTHAHICPDKIAKAVEDITSKRFGPLYGSFRVSSLLDNMKKYGIDISIVSCIAERPEVVKAANDFVINVQDGKRIVGVGTIHPDFEDYKQEIEKFKQQGIRGIKWNSEVQGCYPDEERMLRIYPEMGEDMIACFHAGEDIGEPLEKAHTTPQRLARVLDMFPKLKVVAAHFGGLHMLEEVRKYLLGKELYFDTAWYPSVTELNPQEIAQLIKEHGSHKILFGTDYPAVDAKEQIDWVSNLPLSAEDKELIFYKNAKRLYGI